MIYKLFPGNILDSCFKTFGRGSAMWVKGRHVDEAIDIKNDEITKHLNCLL